MNITPDIRPTTSPRVSVPTVTPHQGPTRPTDICTLSAEAHLRIVQNQLEQTLSQFRGGHACPVLPGGFPEHPNFGPNALPADPIGLPERTNFNLDPTTGWPRLPKTQPIGPRLQPIVPSFPNLPQRGSRLLQGLPLRPPSWPGFEPGSTPKWPSSATQSKSSTGWPRQTFNRGEFEPTQIAYPAVHSAPEPAQSAPKGAKVTPLTQSNSISCGQTSVAMAVNSVTGKSLTDSDIAKGYGLSLLTALNTESRSSGVSWADGGDLDSKSWPLLEKKLNQEEMPVLLGLNGPEFSSSGNGHIVTLMSIEGDKVRYADPADGTIKTTTKSNIESAPGHPDGKFIYYPSRN